MSVHPRTIALVLALAASAGAAVPAAGQGILGRAAKKAAEAAAARKMNPASAAKTPVFSDTILQITSERIALVARGLGAEQAAYTSRYASADSPEARYTARQRQYEADLKVYEQRKQAYDAESARIQERIGAWQQCMQSSPGYQQAQGEAMAMAQRMMAMSPSERAAFQKQLQGYQARVRAARDRGDTLRAMVIADSAARLMGLSRTAPPSGASTAQKCGPMPTEMDPAAMQQRAAQEPQKPVAPDRPANVGIDYDTLTLAGASAAGLTKRQYAILKERILAFLYYGDQLAARSSYVYTPEELEALRASSSKVEPYRSAIRGDQIDYEAWGKRPGR